MANPRQRKKQKNPQMKAKRMKQTKKPAIPNIDVIKNNWDKKLTLQQNYEKLGLAARLNGGTDGKGNNFMNSLPRPELTDEQMENMDAKTISRIMGPGFGVVERDEQGNITKVTVADDDDFLDTPLPPAPAKTDVVRGKYYLSIYY
jgi:nucleolar protein 16